MPANAAILTAKSGLEFEDGSPALFANGVYVHHILIADLNKPTAPFALCPVSRQPGEAAWVQWAGYILDALGAGLIQVGNDANHDPNFFGTKGGNVKAAYMTGKDDTFLLQAEIVNYRKEPQRVFLQFDVEYLPGKVGGEAVTAFTTTTGEQSQE